MKRYLITNTLRIFLAIIIFSTAAVAQTEKLKGNWNLTGLKQNGKAIDIYPKPRAGKRLGISFADEKRFGLISTCNGMGADYAADAKGNFKPGAIIGTRMFCGDAAMKIETALADAMQAVTKYEIKNNRLILRDRSGKNILTFSRAK
ncbi:MAG TPA: META domain-containing protein [Pyrinomonadaceae bacterium]|nr:META domain-containing protein [Pyrinomonadaceae bacterium]